MGAAGDIGYQIACKNIGESGSNFLAILHAFGGTDGALGWYYTAIDNGWLAPDCLVIDGGRLASILSGTKWNMRKEGPDYKPRLGEVEILRFEVVETGVTYAHFVNGDGLGSIAHDPWPGSLTVKNGKLISKRIYSRG